MKPPQSASRAEFTVRCACGIEYHTNDEHLGKQLPCRCGRTVVIARPAEANSPDITRNASSSGRRRSSKASELFTADREAEHTHRRHRSRKESSEPGFLASFSTYREGRRTRSRTRRDNEAQHSATSSSSGRRYRSSASRLQRTAHATSVWLASTLRPVFFGNAIQRTTAILAWGYLVAVTLSWMLLVFTSERVLPGTIIAYGPRFLVLFPLLALVPMSALFARATLWPLLLGAWIAFVPVMGARFSPSTLVSGGMPAVPGAGTFRILTFNVENGGRLSYDLPVLLREQHPDIITFQECGDKLWAALQQQSGWYTKRYASLCTGSRWPIGQVDIMPREDLARISAFGFGGTGLVMRAFLDTPHGPLVLINLHLETARKGLESMLGKEGFVPDEVFSTAVEKPEEVAAPEPSQLRRFEINTLIRTAESQRAAHYASQGMERAAIVVAGDFNLPVESTIFQDHWRGFTDAFESKGNGLGWSKREGRWLRIRIDHVLTNPVGPRPVRIALGPDYSSDHLPVIVDLAWPATTRARVTP